MSDNNANSITLKIFSILVNILTPMAPFTNMV